MQNFTGISGFFTANNNNNDNNNNNKNMQIKISHCDEKKDEDSSLRKYAYSNI